MGPLGKQLENISPAAFLPSLSVILISLVPFVPPMSSLFPLHQSWFNLDTAMHDRNMSWIFTLGIKIGCIVSAATADSELDCMLGINILFEEAICALVKLFLNTMSGAPGHQAGNEVKY